MTSIRSRPNPAPPPFLGIFSGCCFHCWAKGLEKMMEKVGGRVARAIFARVCPTTKDRAPSAAHPLPTAHCQIPASQLL